MITIKLLIDEEGIKLPRDVTRELMAFTDLMERVRQNQCERWWHSNLFNIEVMPGTTLNNVLYQRDHHVLEPDYHRLLVEQLNRCSRLDDVENPSLTTAEQATTWKEQGQAVACLVLQSGTSQASPGIHVVKDETSLLAFYREVPEMVECSEFDYINHAAHRAFPNLFFKPGIDREFSRFQEPYPSIRKKVTQALAILNDRLQAIRIECNQDPQQVEKKLSSEIGFKTSPESPNTHHNTKAMRERDATIDNQTVCCEWHVKFQPTTDRLHFHFGRADVAGGRPLICHFVDHFTT